MKKTLVSALTTALVVGAASTTFAAANPFSDVPADHWAYDAVTQLAQDGVVEGYGDNSFRGDRNITRYEMAQIVAKAMAKTDVSAADKAMIDKLAAEFADELNNLGVRVSNLERNADMVKWNGKAEYTYSRHHQENQDRQADSKANENTFLFRLEPSAEVNSNWHVKARIDAKVNAAEDTEGDVKLKRIWAQGDYKNFQVKLGKFAPLDNDSIMDTTNSGAEVTFGSKVKFIAGAARLNLDDLEGELTSTDKDGNTYTTNLSAGNHYYAGLNYENGKFFGGVHYHGLNFNDVIEYKNGKWNKDLSSEVNNAHIWAVAANYKFDKNNNLYGLYARANDWLDDDDVSRNVYDFEYQYKGAEQENRGTWGAWLAYRHLGTQASLFPTWDIMDTNEAGWEIGGNYTFAKNIVGTVRYGQGHKIDGYNDKDGVSKIFGRVEFFF